MGFVGGLLIPSTRVEDEKLGPMADQVKDKAKETGEEAVERGKEVAQQAAQSAKETAQEAGREHAEGLKESAQKRPRRPGSRPAPPPSRSGRPALEAPAGGCLSRRAGNCYRCCSIRSRARRAQLDSEQVRALLGAIFFALSVLYVVKTIAAATRETRPS